MQPLQNPPLFSSTPFIEMHVNVLFEETMGFINENMETWLAFQVYCSVKGVPAFKILT
jgi:hypothetical protein